MSLGLTDKTLSCESLKQPGSPEQLSLTCRLQLYKPRCT
jgi:hypothetical protein